MSNSKEVTFAVASTQQTIPNQEQRHDMFSKPVNRFERRAKAKQKKKVISRYSKR